MATPETPNEGGEGPERRPAATRNRRANQTAVNLVLSLLASLAIVLALVLVVVRPDQVPREAVDYGQIAEQSQPGVTEALAAPALPEGWSANRAILEQVPDDAVSWYIGFLTPGDGFIALEQGIGTTGAWLADLLGADDPTGTVLIDGIRWEVHDRRGSDDPGNYAYSLVTTAGGSSFVLHGAADPGEFAELASALALGVE